MDMYGKDNCPKCKKHFYIPLGDFQDMTVEDITGAICPYCGHKYLFEGVDLIEGELASYENGVKYLK